ncbi:SWI/SNF-related matrix-associated actin-dependent regulator of chromatin subfamily A containing DEAD/H box 1B-like isoform X2 [Pomacea canaliculata]|uniref:SWI/SNF-related matrix-associated actin-dependent regulator of chromatin subfamily A containing DEAD/H box 1B-like isoform X2 n=1 Tax=Pomacea canaliculata TaxID=400727 RepID=UPI000D737DFB|nr:SWI/SNF-related matrix-associated actin-dependent regulator of chromatin subfamily A containing DEAD/H box 1B-like isoform X2 [Pomacea canaliculata]
MINEMAGKETLNSLLKYRFVRRSSSKSNHTDSSSNDSLSSGQINGEFSADSSSSRSPVTSVSQETLPSVDEGALSPVFNKTCTQPPSLPDVPSISSPWLSKSYGVETNESPTQKSDSQVGSHIPAGSVSSCGKKALWEEKLRTMFPAASSVQISAALSAVVKCEDIEQGVNYLKGVVLKRKNDHTDDESSLMAGGKASYKRIRVMSSTDSEDSLQVMEHLQHRSQSQEQCIEFLREAFPTLSSQRLRQVLEDCNWQTDQAAVVLSREATDSVREPHLTSTNVIRSSSSQDLQDVLVISDDDDDDNYHEEEEEDSDDSMDEDKNQSKKDIILSFFEEATMAELLVLPGCSRKKAEAIVDCRPFKTWDNLVERFTNSKVLSYALVGGCMEIIQLRNVVLRLMRQCKQISEQVELVVARLTSHLEGPHDENGQIMTQPSLLCTSFELKPYQLIGLNWLRIMHSQHLNGILADEMGLGKTIQAIAFLAHLLEEGENGPHVIIVPSSTIENWLRELSAWCPELRVIVYYGSQEERRETRHSIMYGGNKDFHVLLTTYNMATGGVEDRSLFKKFSFHYAVFDEGHMLKNMSSLRFQNLMKISAERRLLLTGTPLQNNLLELISLLCFVMPDIFQGKTEPLKKMFSMISRGDSEQGKYEKERIAQAQRIMKPFVLRRLKKDVLTQLPKKEESIEYCSLLPEQQELYDSLLRKFSEQVENDGTEAGGGIAMFMQLRKAANHPLLLRNHYTEERLKKMAEALAKEPSHRERGALPKLIMEDMSVMNDFDLQRLCQQYKKHLGKFELPPKVIGESGKFQVLDRLLQTMQNQGDRVLLFSQFTMVLDVVEVFLKQKQITYIRLDGSTPVTDRQQLIDQFTEDPSIFIFLLSTRAGGLGINLTAANVIILHDIDFNPYNDKQAEDRCHRLGQKRSVKIVRLISKNTVEEGMLRVAQAKLRLEQDVTATTDENSEAAIDVATLLHEAIDKVKGGHTAYRRQSPGVLPPSLSSAHKASASLGC